MWLKEFKKALILKDFDTLDSLIDQMPSMESLAQMEEASYLFQNARVLIESEQVATLRAMQQLKNTLDFLKATENSISPTINIKL
ncbi:MAG: hypothetical protein NTY39_04110 [Campylobacterales bacterium]|nr:hypothetical protein [Campylobacterales bacterium]